jgi:glycosyltransferase involved in cell wall biosynthesis
MRQRLVIITPCRDEEHYLPITLTSMVRQTRLPDLWIIVDDGSRDATPDLAAAYAAKYPWIRLLRRPRAGQRQLGPGVVRAFNAGLAYLGDEPFDVIAKFDADLEFAPEYLARIMAHFDHPRAGIIGGTSWLKQGDKLLSERHATFHVGGQNKFYRRACFQEIGGIQPVYGWDIIDETDARRRGWRTFSDPGITIVHHRMQGETLGALRGRMIWGMGAYAIGSHPLFALARGIFRMAERPWLAGGLAFIFGFCSSYCRSDIQRITDPDLIRYLRREQLYRLRHGNRLPHPPPAG